MTEEVVADQVVEPTQQEEAAPEQATTQEPTQKEFSSAEQKAMEQGWKPQEDYEGDPDKWVDAKEFLRRGELFEKIDSLGRELKDAKKVINLLKNHHEKVRETEYKRALDDLKAQKKQAYEEGNVDQIVELDDKIATFKEQVKVERAAEAERPNEPNPAFVAWVQQNKWYANDSEMRTFADDIGMAHARANPSKTPQEVLKYVEERVRKSYPEKFTNPNRTKPAAVEGATAPKATKKDDFELSDEERKAMNAFVRSGVMSKDEYISQIKSIRGVR
jgi:hypothetical protein